MADQPPPAYASSDIGDDSQSARKRRAILESATVLFLQSGYLGTSMDEIAALAGVSKQTVYKHFEDKQRLFAEIVISSVNEVGDPNTSEVQSLGSGDDVEAELRDLARGQLSARAAAEAAATAPAGDRRVVSLSGARARVL